MQKTSTEKSDSSEKIDLMPRGAGANRTTSAKHKNIGIIIAVILATTIAIAGAIIIVLLLRFRNSFQYDSPYKHSSFFIPESTDENAKYALFDKDGNNLTGFTIKTYCSFIDGYALIQTEDGWSIIGEDGKTSVRVNQYDGISRVGGLYSAFKAGSGKHRLIHGSGRIVTEFDAERNHKLDDRANLDSRSLAVAIHREDDKYDIYNAHGEFVRQINSGEAPTISYNSGTGIEDSSTIISYDVGVIILANQDLSEAINVNMPNKYNVSSMSKDRKLVVLYRSGDRREETSTEPYQTIYDKYRYARVNLNSGDKYAIINNGSYFNFEDQCRYISISNSSNNNTGYARCYTKDGSSFIDKTNKIHQLSTDYDGDGDYSIIDGGHYALYDRQNKTATIDKDIIENVDSIAVKDSYFLISISSERSIFDKDGKKLCDLPKDVDDLVGFNRDGVSIVKTKPTYKTSTTNNETVSASVYKEYLINQDCDAISEQYDRISEVGNFYQAIKYDDEVMQSRSVKKSALLDKAGKVQIDFGKYNSFSATRNNANHSLITASKSGGKTDLLKENLDVVDEINSYPSFDADQNIYKAKTDKFVKYITPEGVIVYSVPRGNGARSQI